MEEQIHNQLQDNHWLNTAEIVAAAGSIAGSIAAIFAKEIILASAPLSACVVLNLINRKRLLNLTTTQNNNAIAELSQHNQNDLANMCDQIAQLQQSGNNLNEEMSHQLAQLNTDLSQRTQELQQNYTQMASEVEKLTQIQNSSQLIQESAESAESCCQNGDGYQQLGQKEKAIEEYTKAIKIDAQCAKAYSNRGLLFSQMGQKQAAVLDLRKAAKLYFEQGDLSNYQKTRNMTQEIHQLNYGASKQNPQQVLANSLFAG